MRIPPAPENLFKFKKGGKRLRDWLVRGSGGDEAQGLAYGIIALKPPELVAPPPGAAARDARATAAWNRVRETARSRARAPLRSVNADTEDGEETNDVLSAVMRASRDAGATQSAPEGEGGSSSTDGGGTVERPDQSSSTALDRGDSPRDSSASADTGGGLTLEDIERELMADSDDEGGGEAGDRQASAEGGTGRQQQADGLSDYELERQENIRRNNQILRDLGLEEDPLIPQRPPPAPRQPRQPPGPPTRSSERVRGQERGSYSEADADREFERQLAEDDEQHDSGEGLTRGEIDDALNAFARVRDG